jgi:hypothetical protein
MEINTIRTFFLWCTIINGAILIFAPLFCILARDWVCNIHNRLFKVSRETANMMLYSFIALYKMLWMVFNLVPYIALLIIGG